LEPPDDLYGAVMRDVAVTPQRRRRLLRLPDWVLATTLGLIVLTIGSVWLASRQGEPDVGAPTPRPTTSEVPMTTLPPLDDLPVGGAIKRTLPDPGAWPASFAHGSLWLANELTGELVRMDPTTGDVIARIAFEASDNPYSPNVAVTADGVWVNLNQDQEIHHVNATTNEVDRTHRIGAVAYSIVPFGDDLWITDYRGGVVLRIDGMTGDEVAWIDVTGQPSSLVVVGGDAWVASPTSGRIIRIDGETNDVTGSFPIVRDTSHLLASGDQIFAFGVGFLGVDRFNTVAERVEARTVGMAGLAELDGVLWGVMSERKMVRLDPETLEGTAVIDFGDAVIDFVVAGGGSLWLSGVVDGESRLYEAGPTDP
jgi:streptogramin lyase